jgi:hypothetical protein
MSFLQKETKEIFLMKTNQKIADFEDGSIDAGLALLSRIPHPAGEHWTAKDIAFVCGCSVQNIQHIEMRAKAKLKKALLERGIEAETIL